MEPDALPQPSPKPVSVQQYGFFSHWRELLNQINLRHSVRHTYGQVESGTDIRTVQDLLGHVDVTTTQIYTHVLNRPGFGVRSPYDAL